MDAYVMQSQGAQANRLIHMQDPRKFEFLFLFYFLMICN